MGNAQYWCFVIDPLQIGSSFLLFLQLVRCSVIIVDHKKTLNSNSGKRIRQGASFIIDYIKLRISLLSIDRS